MGRALVRNVYVDGKGYGPAFSNADRVPADVAARVTNRRAWGDVGESHEPAPVRAAASEGAAPPAVARPAGNASKADWVAYAVARGVDGAEAEALTRTELRDLFDEAG